jgi:hypothetical protein
MKKGRGKEKWREGGRDRPKIAADKKDFLGTFKGLFLVL